jgi:hypothetical protein
MMESQAPMPPIEPARPMPVPGDRRGLAIASLVLGIISLCGAIFWFCGGPLAIVAVVLGVLSRNSSARSMATAGIILGAIGIVLAIVFVILTLTSGPIIQQFQHQLQQMQSTLQANP